MPRRVAGMRAAASAARPAGDAGNDAERHARGGERLRLLGPARKDKRVAALEPQHPLAGAGERDEALRNVLLGRRRLAAALAGEFEPRPRSLEREHPRIDQRVVNDDVGLIEPGQRIEGEEPGIARSCPGEPDMARLQHRNAAAPRRKVGPRGHGERAPGAVADILKLRRYTPRV